MKTKGTSILSCALSLASFMSVESLLLAPAASAQEASSCSIDWSKLDLSASQNSQIQALEQQWYKDFNEISPQIRDEQVKLQKLLAGHNPDSLQIVALQQSIARRKEQLQLAAMQNYLAKRKLLSEKQQLQLEQMIQANVNKRRSQLYPGSQTEVMPDKIQMLMQRVKSIFPVPDSGNP